MAVLLFHGSTWSDPYVKDTVFINIHIIKNGLLLIREIWLISLFEESHCSPTFLKAPIY